MSLGWSPAENEELSPNSLQNLLSNAQNNNFTFLAVPVQVKREIFTNFQDLETLQRWQLVLFAWGEGDLFDSRVWSRGVLCP